MKHSNTLLDGDDRFLFLVNKKTIQDRIEDAAL